MLVGRGEHAYLVSIETPLPSVSAQRRATKEILVGLILHNSVVPQYNRVSLEKFFPVTKKNNSKNNLFLQRSFRRFKYSDTSISSLYELVYFIFMLLLHNIKII